MKTFEDNLSAWLDGKLQGKELADFEASLPQISEAELERQQDELKLSALLKEHIGSRPMSNQEFFNHQLRTQIESETATERAPHHGFAQPKQSWWSIGRLAWSGAASLAIFAVCTFFVLRQEDPTGQSPSLTKILTARVDPTVSPDATISMFETKEEAKVTVLWVDGLQSLPSEYAAK